MKNLIIDLDNTLTIDDKALSYEEKKPNLPLVAKLKEYQKMGFKITIFTSRNMKTYKGDIDKIEAHTLPLILKWLEKHKIPFDEVRIGKAWCGEQGFYVDDKAVRPSEFVNLSYEEILALLKAQNAEALQKVSQDTLQDKEFSQSTLNSQNKQLSQNTLQEQGGGGLQIPLTQSKAHLQDSLCQGANVSALQGKTQANKANLGANLQEGRSSSKLGKAQSPRTRRKLK